MLKKKGLVSLLLIAGPCALIHSSVEALHLKDALERAPEANFQILLAGEGLRSQEELTRATRAALLPQIQLDATQGRNMSPNIDPFSKSIPGIPKRFFVDRFDAVLRARLSLINTRSIDDWRLSKLDLQATELRLQNTTQDILRQIAVAYVTHWRNEQKLAVIDKTLERDRILKQIAVDQRDAGVATTLDITRTEVALAGNELIRLQQETMVMESALDLKRALNFPLDKVFTVQVGDLIVEEPGSQAQDLAAILGARADYQKLLAELEHEQMAYKAAWREHLPSVELSGQWGYASEAWSDSMEEQWAIQLGVSVPVFEGFRIDAKKRASASAVRAKEIELNELKSQIDAQYRLIQQQFQSSHQQVQVARRARDLNAREFELERIRFQEGVADNSDVVDAQTRLANAEDRLVEAQYQLLLTWINRARVSGDVMSLVQE